MNKDLSVYKGFIGSILGLVDERERKGYFQWSKGGGIVAVPTFPNPDRPNEAKYWEIVVEYQEEIDRAKLNSLAKMYGHLHVPALRNKGDVIDRKTIIIFADRAKGFVRSFRAGGIFVMPFVKRIKQRWRNKYNERSSETLVSQAKAVLVRFLEKKCSRMREVVKEKGIEIFGALKEATERLEASAKKIKGAINISTKARKLAQKAFVKEFEKESNNVPYTPEMLMQARPLKPSEDKSRAFFKTRS